MNISWDPQEDSASEKRISVIVQYAEQGHSSRNIVSYTIVVSMSYVHEVNKILLSRQLMSRTRKYSFELLGANSAKCVKAKFLTIIKTRILFLISVLED